MNAFDRRSGPGPTPDGLPAGGRHTLLWLITGQVALHSAMAGQRMAAPLQALHGGASAWRVGVLLALFAALPVLTAMAAGRMADRHGYHRPLRVAVGGTMAGASCALLACALQGWPQFALMCVGAALAGLGTNVGLIAIQRSAGQLTSNSTERLRVFSWLGMAPSLANVVGPVAAGLMIDAGGYASAYGLMLVLPLVSLWVARRVPKEVMRPMVRPHRSQRQAWDLFRRPGFSRLMLVSWMLSASWDVHSFAVPVLGHARGYSASTIGLLLGTFTAAVTLIRFAIPLLAHRLDEVRTLMVAMVGTGLVFAFYPLAPTPWWMALCAALLGLNLGAVQPMVMSTLYHLTPADRQGEALALRSMVNNFSSSLMPLAFGVAGAALGPAVLFWLVGAAVAAGSLAARGLRETLTASRAIHQAEPDPPVQPPPPPPSPPR